MGSIVIAGVNSSVGKTTVTMGIIDALQRRGLKVQPFKVGPDYIDPSYHTSMVENNCRQSRNLDSWMIPHNTLLELYDRAMVGADIGVVEGVMGLYDGYSGNNESGSTAQIAKLIGAPVILVLDISHMARSAAATILGFKEFDAKIQLAGVILNFVGSQGHLQSVTEAIRNRVGIPVLGHLQRNSGLTLQQRHLGLVPTGEKMLHSEFKEAIAKDIERNFDIDCIKNLALGNQYKNCSSDTIFPHKKLSSRVRIAIARDEAFNFYYQDNLDLLEAWGAELVTFSPLNDPKLPPEIEGIYIGGGFPEMFAGQLSANNDIIGDIRRNAQKGIPVYAECGGLMYLSEGILDFQNINYSMLGLVPGQTVIGQGKLSLGYAEVEARIPSLLMDAGERARGHEFHYSWWEYELPRSKAAYTVLNRGNKTSGFVKGNILASYIHIHFASNKNLAPHFIESCALGASKGKL